MHFSSSSVFSYFIPLYTLVRPHHHHTCILSLLTAFVLFSCYSCWCYVLVKIEFKIKTKILLGFNKIECCKLYIYETSGFYCLYSLKCSGCAVSGIYVTHYAPSQWFFHLVTLLCCFWRCLGLTSIFRTVDSSIGMCIKMFSSGMSKHVVRGVHSCKVWNIRVVQCGDQKQQDA